MVRIILIIFVGVVAGVCGSHISELKDVDCWSSCYLSDQSGSE